jgi:hypothetical protein
MAHKASCGFDRLALLGGTGALERLDAPIGTQAGPVGLKALVTW